LLVKNSGLMRDKPQTGFTVIELLVVIIIVTILSAITLPAMLSQSMKARQSEAKVFVSAVNRAQQAYRTENVVFAESMAQLNLLGEQQSKYYAYNFATSTQQGSVMAIPLVDQGAKSYAGSTVVSSHEAAIPTIICETTAGNLPVEPIWNSTNETLDCHSSMKAVTN